MIEIMISLPLHRGRILRSSVLGACSFLMLCEVSRANTIEFTANLSGPAESPPNASVGTGTADVLFDDVANTLQVIISFADLGGLSLASHIHAPTLLPGTGTAGVATTIPSFAGFPLGVTSGTFDTTLDLTSASSYNPAFITANGGTTASAETALVSSLIAGDSYLNIHSSLFPSGEIRGFLSQKVPEAGGTAPLLLGAMCGLFVFVPRKRRPACG